MRQNNEISENNVNEENRENKEKQEKKPLSERVEDALDEAVYKTQNAIYGERNGLKEDLPATMEDPNGFRRINKFATRRNLGRMLLKNPKLLLIGLGIFFGVIAVAVVVALIV